MIKYELSTAFRKRKVRVFVSYVSDRQTDGQTDKYDKTKHFVWLNVLMYWTISTESVIGL